jgi:hypothetical protein
MPVEGNVPPAREGQRAGRAVALALGAFVIALVGFAAGWMLGARRTIVTAASPAGDAIAFVSEGRCSTGRCEALRVGRAPSGSSARTLEALTGDEHASEIAWTPDGGRVAFLVNGYQLRVFDAHTGANLGAVTLVDPDGFPPSRIARGVTFSANGAAVTFDECPRTYSGCRAGLLALKLR